MDKMKALVFRDVGKIELDEIPIPHAIQPDDVGPRSYLAFFLTLSDF